MFPKTLPFFRSLSLSFYSNPRGSYYTNERLINFSLFHRLHIMFVYNILFSPPTQWDIFSPIYSRLSKCAFTHMVQTTLLASDIMNCIRIESKYTFLLHTINTR